MDWIDVLDAYPKDGQRVIGSFWCNKTRKFYELETVFTDAEDYRLWKTSPPEGTDLTSMPQTWKPIAEGE